MPLMAQDQKSRKRFAIALHGGAGKSPTDEDAPAVMKAMNEALDRGVKELEAGGSSLNAVEKVIRFLEDDEHFNAGKGAAFNSADGHELDASIMNGKNRACGAVAAVRTVKNPISLARLVLEKSKHVLFTSDGAEKFADEMGDKIERVDNSSFNTERQKKNLKDARKRATRAVETPYYGTVGCVALDSAGDLAAGTSTGGITNKKPGRIGDSPIIGAGTYADNATCAISCTGTGEQFIRHAVAHDIHSRLAYLKQPLGKAVEEVLYKTLSAGDGGLIALTADGDIVMEYTTEGMARAAADSSGLREVKIGR
jgi:beta-aspartyl-peptidase (threonine type)